MRPLPPTRSTSSHAGRSAASTSITASSSTATSTACRTNSSPSRSRSATPPRPSRSSSRAATWPSHPRRRDRRVSTTAEHLPSAHRAHAEWTPSRLIGCAARVGPRPPNSSPASSAAAANPSRVPDPGRASCAWRDRADPDRWAVSARSTEAWPTSTTSDWSRSKTTPRRASPTRSTPRWCRGSETTRCRWAAQRTVWYVDADDGLDVDGLIPRPLKRFQGCPAAATSPRTAPSSQPVRIRVVHDGLRRIRERVFDGQCHVVDFLTVVTANIQVDRIGYSQ